MSLSLKPHKDLVNDPNFPFMVGRIVGACESAAILLQAGKLSADELHEVGVKLDEVVAWFLNKKITPHLAPPPSEQPTQIKPPEPKTPAKPTYSA